ncbi:ALF repeat-containing protein, partial [Streptomyces sp. NPDC044948]
FKAATAAGNAAASAISAGSNADAAADAAMKASSYAGDSSAAAAEARAAAAATKRHAQEANRAAAEAERLARKAATAAADARDAARSAATHARNAAAAADDAADHAGDAAKAATESTKHANAASEAANTASATVVKAQEIYQLAREVEAEELLGRTNAGIERAKDQAAADAARTAGLAELDQAARDRDTERDRLVALAAEPGADRAATAAQGRTLAVLTMKNGTAWGRAAAEAALAGDDDVVLDYLKNGWQTAREQDERTYVARLAEESATPEIRAAAETALAGDAAAVTAFVQEGQYQAASQSMRIAIAQIVSAAGPVVTEKGRAALGSGDPKKFSEFLVATQYTAQTQDERVRAAQLVSVGGPEVKSAARVALAGSPATLHAFIATGQYTAARKDQLTATHVAQVQKLIADASKIAATAQKDAALAQKVAAEARKAADDANGWAQKADEYADQAQGYADEAARHAKDAEASAASAAQSAATARAAAKDADRAAKDAALSATDATLSSEMAQVSASSAWVAAEQARASATAAGKDAEAANKAATEALVIATKKYREEEEARRKAAIAAKEKAMNDPGARAREIYRCGQALVPCDPQGFARWCTHNEVYCQILAYGDEFNDAMQGLWGVTAELTGLTELEACLDNKDLEHCWSLAADVLVSAKLKALNKAFDSLKWVKRGCKVVSRLTTLSAAQAAGAGKGCLEGETDYDVFDPDTGKKITDIDLFEDDILWEDKSVLGSWTDEGWLDKHIDAKFEKYLKARKQLPGEYQGASIGFRFTRPDQDARFVAAVEARFNKLREKYPDVHIMTKWF